VDLGEPTSLNAGQLPASFLALAGFAAFFLAGGWIAVSGIGLVGFSAAFSLVMIVACRRC
jgi:hypothetical protein